MINVPTIGYKKKFKNIKGLQNEIFIVNFKLEYNSHGFLEIQHEDNNYFDVGDFNILLDRIFDDFTEEKRKKYDNGIYILSVCKYIVGNDCKANTNKIYNSRHVITYYTCNILCSIL